MFLIFRLFEIRLSIGLYGISVCEIQTDAINSSLFCLEYDAGLWNWDFLYVSAVLIFFKCK